MKDAMYSLVGMLRVKNEERWLDRALRSIEPLCEHVLVFDDNSTDRTVEIASSFKNVVVAQTPFTGQAMDEARDKDLMVQEVAHRWHPDFVIAIDGDEELEPKGPKLITEMLQQYGDMKQYGPFAAYSFRVCYLWNSERMYRDDGVYGTFHRPSLFRLRGVDPSRLRYTRTNAKHNLHCSNFPQGISGQIFYAPIRLKHYGYMHLEDRRRKYEWYNAIDPNNTVEDRYKHVIELPSVHAPGPTHLSEWRD